MMFMPNARARAEDYCDGFGLTEHELSLIRSLPAHSRCFLVRQPDASVVVRLDLSGAPEVLTDPVRPRERGAPARPAARGGRRRSRRMVSGADRPRLARRRGRRRSARSARGRRPNEHRGLPAGDGRRRRERRRQPAGGRLRRRRHRAGRVRPAVRHPRRAAAGADRPAHALRRVLRLRADHRPQPPRPRDADPAR